MKKLITLTLILSASVCMAQQRQPEKVGVTHPIAVDTTLTYTLTEPTILQISNILAMANDLAATSDKISANQYNAYVKQIAHVDSTLRVQYLRYHPQTIKK